MAEAGEAQKAWPSSSLARRRERNPIAPAHVPGAASTSARVFGIASRERLRHGHQLGVTAVGVAARGPEPLAEVLLPPPAEGRAVRARTPNKIQATPTRSPRTGMSPAPSPKASTRPMT